jgi:hypothetical protein
VKCRSNEVDKSSFILFTSCFGESKLKLVINSFPLYTLLISCVLDFCVCFNLVLIDFQFANKNLWKWYTTICPLNS